MKSPNLLLVIFFIISYNCTRQPDKIIGVKIYEYYGNYDALAQQWKETGINTAFVSTGLAANDTFRQALRKQHISVFIIFPVFQNPEFLKQDSSLYAITDKGKKAKEDWVEFVCPSRESYRNAKIAELAGIVERYDPEGISIDFIRQFVFWEMIYPGREPGSIDRACFCDNCIAEFSYTERIDIPDTCVSTLQKAGFINSNYAVQYDSFRCFLITTMVKDLAETAKDIKPKLKISVHAVPWREGDFGGANLRVAGQDLEKIAPYADFISPMCYSQMLKRDAGWISSVVEDMDKREPGKVLPSIQVYPYYIDDAFTAEDFRQCIDSALQEPSRGVVFWSWPLLEKEKRRVEVVKEEMRD